MDYDIFTDRTGAVELPDEAFREACSGYCRMAMKRMGVSQDAQDCILDSLWEVFDTVSVDGARQDWKKR